MLSDNIFHAKYYLLEYHGHTTTVHRRGYCQQSTTRSSSQRCKQSSKHFHFCRNRTCTTLENIFILLTESISTCSYDPKIETRWPFHPRYVKSNNFPTLTDLFTEYCTQLRTNIQKGSGLSAADRRHIDTTEFWKEQYTKIHVEKKALEDKIRCLEEHQRSQRQPDSNEHDIQSALDRSRKRRPSTQNVEAWLDDQEDPDSADQEDPDSANQDVLLRLSSYSMLRNHPFIDI